MARYAGYHVAEAHDAGGPVAQRGGQAAEAGLQLIGAEREVGRQAGGEEGRQRYYAAAPRYAVDETGCAAGEDEEGEDEGRHLMHRPIVAMDHPLRNMLAS